MTPTAFPTVAPGTPLWMPSALLSLLFTVETGWKTLVARIFRPGLARRACTGVKPVTDRCFTGLFGLTGRKIATT